MQFLRGAKGESSFGFSLVPCKFFLQNHISRRIKMFQVFYGLVAFLVAAGLAVLAGFWLAKRLFPWLGRSFQVPPQPVAKGILSAIGALVVCVFLGMFLVPLALTLPAPRLPALAPAPKPLVPGPVGQDTSAPIVVSAVYLVPYESEGGIPYSGTSWTADVAPGEVEVLTSGPAEIAGVKLPGGENRGSVIVLLPSSKAISYTVTGLVTGANWHGAYNFGREITEADWRALADDRVAAMKAAPNCTSGKGCLVVDVLVVGPAGKVAYWQR